MRSVPRAPVGRLRPFVPRYLGAEVTGVDPGVHRSPPSPYLTFIISLDEPIKAVHLPDGDCRRRAFPSVVGGLQTAAVSVPHGSSLRIIRVLLSPLGARAVLGVRAAEIASGVFGLPEVMGPRGEELVERLAGAGSWPERFAVLDEVLVSGLEERSVVSTPLQRAWRQISSTEAAPRVDAVARDVGLSRRHLTGRFAAEFGLTPKVAMRVARLDRARRQLQTNGESLSAVAVACGYVDQAHLTREWRALTGVPPAAWMAAEHLPNLQDMPLRPPTQWSHGRSPHVPPGYA